LPRPHPKLTRLLEDHPNVHHVKVEDGPSKPLRQSFGVKLWPTLVFLEDGKVVEQVNRPGLKEVQEGLTTITGAGLAPTDH